MSAAVGNDISVSSVTDEFLAAKSAEFETAQAADIVRWTLETFPNQVFLTTAWQRQGMVLIDLVYKIAPDTPVLFIDTGFHFPETLSYALEMTARFKLNMVVCKPRIIRDDFEKQHGPRPAETDAACRPYLDTCCAVNKKEPLQREIARLDRKVWIAGLRRDQGKSREKTPIVLRQPDGIIKVNPLAKWTSKDVFQYLKAADIPQHPLYAKGYTSIGCSPETCTRPPLDPDDERSGRWAGTDKKECGIHYQI